MASTSDNRKFTWMFWLKVFHFSSACLPETCVSTILDSCFLLRREVCLGLVTRLALVGRFSFCSWVLITLSLDGSSGGASGHGVCFAGTVISKGGLIIHLYAVKNNVRWMQSYMEKSSTLIKRSIIISQKIENHEKYMSLKLVGDYIQLTVHTAVTVANREFNGNMMSNCRHA